MGRAAGDANRMGLDLQGRSDRPAGVVSDGVRGDPAPRPDRARDRARSGPDHARGPARAASSQHREEREGGVVTDHPKTRALREFLTHWGPWMVVAYLALVAITVSGFILNGKVVKRQA